MPRTRTPNPMANTPPAQTYAALVAELPPRPLHDRADYDNAVEMVGRLVGLALNADQTDYLEALTLFVEMYQEEHDETRVDMRQVSGLDLLRRVLEEHAMSGADLSRLLRASRTLGPMILRGERQLTAQHARILGRAFNLDPGVFIR